MRLLRVLALTALLVPSLAAADPADFLGRKITSVRIEVDGQVVEDARLAGVIETRPGEALEMARVRETIDHLVGLGRYADVRVFADEAPGGVALRWSLTPLRFITRVNFSGEVSLDEGDLRTLITERLGAQIPATETAQVTDLLRTTYRDRGYPFASFTVTLVPSTRAEVDAEVAVQPGPRTTIGSASVVGAAPRPAAELLAELGLQSGRPYDRIQIEERVARYEEDLREQGYYEATADVSAQFAEDGRTASLTLQVQPGRRVRVVFAGDPLDDNRRDELVPIRRERSVDQDLLEDASRNIEEYLRSEGYRSPSAPYSSETVNGELVVTFTVDRGPLHRVGAVNVEGLSALPAEEIQPLLRVETGEPFIDSRVSTIASAITELYHVQGFTRATATARFEVLPEEKQGSESFRPVNVRFIIAEGPRTTVGDVRIDGATAVPEARIREAVRLTTGRPFYRPQLSADRDSIERLYRNEGFQRASVTGTPTISPDGTSASVAWTISEGPRSYVDHILVTGNESSSSDLIRREITLKPGDPLGEQAIVESQQRLSALGLFRRVRITELPHGTSGNRDIVIEVEDAPGTTIAYGGGVEVGRRIRRESEGGAAEERIEFAPRGFFEVGRRNLWGKNRSINLFTRVSLRPRDPAVDNPDPEDTGGYGFNEYRIVGIYREPRAFGTNGDAQITAFLEQAIRSSFNFNRRGVQAEYARRFGQSLTASGRYSFNRTRLFDEQIAPEDQLLIDRLFPRVRLSVFTGSLLRDSRDDVLDPTRGYTAGVDGALAARSIGSEVGFARTFLQGAAYRRLPGRGFVVAASARLGFALGFERQATQEDDNGDPVLGPDGQPMVETVKEVPASERFYAGGDTTVRGFALDRLGTDDTLDDEGFPTGGNGLIVLNLELRAPYWKGLGLVGFLDAGNVFLQASDLSLGELRASAGAGVRYRSPIGPLRVDLGFKLDRRDPLERAYVLHISLGQAF